LTRHKRDATGGGGGPSLVVIVIHIHGLVPAVLRDRVAIDNDHVSRGGGSENIGVDEPEVGDEACGDDEDGGGRTRRDDDGGGVGLSEE
jgi:hypothetical protein